MDLKRGPNCFILGASKAGTTSLYYYLKQHPEVFFSAVKEPHFFDNDDNFSKGVEWYVSCFFGRSRGFKIRGDATPAYLYRTDIVIPRLRSVYPNQRLLKFIVLLRDPVERAWSHYLHMVRNGQESETFEGALDREMERLKLTPDEWIGYFDGGLYSKQLDKWLDVFDRDQFFFLLSEELRGSPHENLKRICMFLEVDDKYIFNVQSKKNVASIPRNKAFMRLFKQPYKVKHPLKLILPPMMRKRIRHFLYELNLRPLKASEALSDELACRIRKAYLEDIKRVETIIGMDLRKWRSLDI
jgi:hypothetical protein